VGELREPEVMRLTLAAAETGHLVLATMHSAGAAEALQRLVGAFAPEVQQSMSAQLADVLVGALAQRLRFHEGQRMLVPECEVLMGSTATRALIRSGQFFKLGTALETGAAEGQYTFARYADWLAKKTDFAHPGVTPELTDELPPPPALRPTVARRPASGPRAAPKEEPVADDGTVVLSGEEEDLSTLIAQLEKD